jgi:hypothetical protein
MRPVVIQNKCIEALNGETQISASLSSVEKIKINDNNKALSAIILYLKDKVLKEVANEMMTDKF